jgi:predicted PurR-regulated permease PerM
MFKAQAKKTIMALCSKEHADDIFEFANYSNMQFGGFINGKIIDSAIIGVLCAILMSIIGLPYTVLVSTIVGITNIIPFFGPFIGAIPGTLIILLESPIQAFYFVILILALQQFDGNILGPKILGETSGLASFWVMFAILVGGGLFGFVGMVLGVPTFAVLYYYSGKLLRKKLKRKNMPEETEEYMEFNKYDINRKDVL